MLAGQRPIPSAHLDVMLPPLLAMTQDVPFYAATVARARLQKMADVLSAALGNLQSAPTGQDAQAAGAGPGRPAQDASAASPWPSSRTFFVLKLFTTLFPLTDKRHPVITPLALFVGALIRLGTQSTLLVWPGVACVHVPARTPMTMIRMKWAKCCPHIRCSFRVTLRRPC